MARKQSKEEASDKIQLTYPKDDFESNRDLRIELYEVIHKTKGDGSPSVSFGIDALLLMNDGYTAKEISVRYGKTAHTVTALVSKAKQHLRTMLEMQIMGIVKHTSIEGFWVQMSM